MPYAILRQGGRQYRVQPGDKIQVDRLDVQPGDEIELQDVLALNDDSNLEIGEPRVLGAVVKAKVLRQDRGKKIVVFKFKRRKGYARKRGHRQQFTELHITGLQKDGKELAAAEAADAPQPAIVSAEPVTEPVATEEKGS